MICDTSFTSYTYLTILLFDTTVAQITKVPRASPVCSHRCRKYDQNPVSSCALKPRPPKPRSQTNQQIYIVSRQIIRRPLNAASRAVGNSGCLFPGRKSYDVRSPPLRCFPLRSHSFHPPRGLLMRYSIESRIYTFVLRMNERHESRCFARGRCTITGLCRVTPSNAISTALQRYLQRNQHFPSNTLLFVDAARRGRKSVILGGA